MCGSHWSSETCVTLCCWVCSTYKIEEEKIRETDNSKIREICKLQSLIKLLKKIREIENYLRCRRRCLLWRLLFRLDRLLRDLLEFGWAGSWAAEAEAEASKGSGVDVILVEVVAGLVKKKWEFWCNNISIAIWCVSSFIREW